MNPKPNSICYVFVLITLFNFFEDKLNKRHVVKKKKSCLKQKVKYLTIFPLENQLTIIEISVQD